MRSYKIKQARLTKQVPGWAMIHDQDIVNVCGIHAALVDRDRSCCVEQCPIIVSEFSLPAILHRPLPFRLKEGTPHRYLCLGHNLRYIDTLRKPMAASAVSEAINNNNSKKEKGDNNKSGARRQRPREAKGQSSQQEDEGEGVSSTGDNGTREVDDKDEDEGDENTSENGDKKKENRKRERRGEPASNEADDKVCTIYIVVAYLWIFVIFIYIFYLFVYLGVLGLVGFCCLHVIWCSIMFHLLFIHTTSSHLSNISL